MATILAFETPAHADATITSEGPLTAIGATSDLNCSVNHRDDSYGAFYGNTACATLVAVGGTLYGPASIPAGGGAAPRTGFTSVDQSGVGGAGSASDPYFIDTTVDAGPLRIRQRDSYVTGFGSYRTDVRVTNTGTQRQTVTVYRAGDCYLADSDVGYGAVEGSAVACQARNVDGGGGSRVEQWAPITAGSRYMEGGYSEVWAHIGSQEEFPNTCRCDEAIDNGAGLSWRFSLEPGEAVTASHLLSFSPRGIAADTNGDGAVRVAVLGDSYIAGVGGVDPGEPYDEGTDTPDNRCRRTSYSWGPMVAARLGATGDNLLFAACGGATSPDVTSRAQQPNSPSGIHGGQAQTTTLRDWANSTPGDIALLSIGGNDVGFADLASDCLLGPCLWFAEERLESRATNARYRLAETYRSVLSALRERNEAAELWVANYPSPVSGEVCGEVGYIPGQSRVNGFGIDRAEQVFLRDRFLRTLNESIAWAADAAGAQVLDLSRMTDGRELCSDQPYINGLSPGPSEGFPFVSARTFHPNKAGYAHLDQEIWSRYAFDFGQAGRTPLGGSGPIPLLAGSMRLGPDPVALQDTAPPEVLFRPGDTVNLRVVDAPPGNYRLVVRSLPTVLREITIPESGDQTITFTVPDFLAPHGHGLTIESTNGVPLLSSTLHVAAPEGCALVEGEADVDGDALPDRCDPLPNDGPNADVDQDGTRNVDDNCPTTENREQLDTDSDGLGDACDPSQGGDPTAGYLTEVDDTPPQTSITAGPAEGSTTDDRTPTFRFSSSEAGSTFRCRIDDGADFACESPYTPSALGEGEHTFAVAAVDAADNTDLSPATRTFTVSAPQGPAAQDPAPQDPAPQSPAPTPPTQPPVQSGPPVEGDPGYTYPAKLRVARARVLREDRALDVFAPVTSRGFGEEVDVAFRAAGRTGQYKVEVTSGDAAFDRIRFRRTITRAQADLGTGIVTISYPGNEATRPQEVRLRAARKHADLEVEQISLQGDRLSAQGALNDEARGVVRLELSYLDVQGTAQVFKTNVKIDDGKWSVDNVKAPAEIASHGAYVSVLFTGYFERRIRGEMISYQIEPGETRRP